MANMAKKNLNLKKDEQVKKAQTVVKRITTTDTEKSKYSEKMKKELIEGLLAKNGEIETDDKPIEKPSEKEAELAMSLFKKWEASGTLKKLDQEFMFAYFDKYPYKLDETSGKKVRIFLEWLVNNIPYQYYVEEGEGVTKEEVKIRNEKTDKWLEMTHTLTQLVKE